MVVLTFKALHRGLKVPLVELRCNDQRSRLFFDFDIRTITAEATVVEFFTPFLALLSEIGRNFVVSGCLSQFKSNRDPRLNFKVNSTNIHQILTRSVWLPRHLARDHHRAP